MTGFISAVRLKAERAASKSAYPYSIPAVAALAKELPLHPKATFFVGENGSGKSTLMEAIAVASGFNAEGGSRNFNFGTRASHSELHEAIRLVRRGKRPATGFFLRAESYFNLATKMEELDREPAFAPPIVNSYGGRSLHEQSHGESFLALLQHRFGSHGLYILDEPEAALSPRRQLAVLARIHRLIEQESQFIIATHSPILLSLPGATIYELSEHGIQTVAYEETETFKVMKGFLDDPSTFLEMLLGRRA